MLAVTIALPYPIPPAPYVQQQAVEICAEHNEATACVVGSTFFVTHRSECRAYKLPKLDLLWSITIPNGDQGGKLLPAGGTLFVSTSPLKEGQGSHLYALDPNTGAVKWSLPCTTYQSELAFSEGRIIATLKDSSVSAVDAITHEVVWTTHFELRHPDNSFAQWVHPITARNGVLAVSCEGTGYILDTRTGAQLWRSDSFRDAVFTEKGVWESTGGHSFGRTLATGEQLWWRKASPFDLGFRTALQGRLIGVEDDEVYALDPDSGRVLWTHDLGLDSLPSRYCYGAIVGNLIFARGGMKGVICDAKGKLVWQGSTLGMFPRPYWADSKSIVCFDGQTLTRYGHANGLVSPKTRAGRRALAADLVAHLERLDRSHVAQLRDLGDDAFQPLLRSFIKTSELKDASGEKGPFSSVRRAMMPVEESLLAVTTPARATDLMHELDVAGPRAYCRPLLLRLLAKVGSPRSSVPYFLRELDSYREDQEMRMTSSVRIAMDYLKDCKDPRAIRWFLRALEDPKTRKDWPGMVAYTNIARTRGKEAVQAVLAQRWGRRLLKPLAVRALDPPKPVPARKTSPITVKTLPDGRTFKFFHSDVLGQRADLWVSQKVNGAWAPGRFMGVSGVDPYSRRELSPPVGTLGGKGADELEAGAWSDFVDDPNITTDSDRDGLTDIAEDRLGTDKNKPDTDGDGAGDAVDPWPNAAPRKLTDSEQILAAVFEATFHFDENDAPAVLSNPGALKPFEMPGRPGPVMWTSDQGAPNEPLNKCWDRGTAFISFGRSHSSAKSWEDGVILWNATKTEATVGISVYFGGLRGTTSEAVVRKFGRDWVVTSLEVVSVS